MYKPFRWLAFGAFFDVGFLIVFDAGLKLRTYLGTDYVYVDLEGIVMFPLGAIYKDFVLYGGEVVLGTSVPVSRRVRLVLEGQVPLMASSRGFVGFFRAMFGLSFATGAFGNRGP